MVDRPQTNQADMKARAVAFAVALADDLAGAGHEADAEAMTEAVARLVGLYRADYGEPFVAALSRYMLAMAPPGATAEQLAPLARAAGLGGEQ